MDPLMMIFSFVLFLVVMFAIFLYLKNLVKAVRQFRNKEYTIKLALRVVGIFVLFVGVFMGAV
jgi:membrane-associated HD superfamily phosphohydrolase